MSGLSAHTNLHKRVGQTRQKYEFTMHVIQISKLNGVRQFFARRRIKKYVKSIFSANTIPK